jgi:hypothetical protein
MGAMSDLDPNNAYTIMSYMSIKVSSSLQLLQAIKACWLSHLLVAVHLAASQPLQERLHVQTMAVGRIHSALPVLHSACWLRDTCSSSGWLDNKLGLWLWVFVCVQDKAALLATMEPDAVARLLGCMDPNEAVLLLSALGDGTSKLVSNYLTSEDRDRLVEVRRMGLICHHSFAWLCLLQDVAWLGP